MYFNNRKVFSLFVSLALVFALVIGVAPLQTFADNHADELIILHTNDMHAKYAEGKYDGMGFAKMKTKINEIKENHENVLLLDAGDAIHGMPLATLTKGEAMVKLMNSMGYDAMAPGNHDFNYGYERLLELKDMAEFDILAANVTSKNGTRDFDAYTIKEMNGLKVGIFGLATPETKYKSSPKNTENVDFVDSVKAAEDAVKDLEKENVDIIIGVTHLGLDEASVETSERVAKEVDGIDVIVDGHSHTVLENGKMVNDTLIVQTKDHTKNLGIVTLKLEDKEIVEKKAELFSKEDATDLEEDKFIKAYIKGLIEANKGELERVIGTSTNVLDGAREHVRKGETNLGNLLTDAMLDIGDADVALANGGGIRDSIDEGDITVNEVIQAFPFENYLVVIEVTGQDIKDALELGTDAYPELKGAFPHVAGMTYEIDPDREIGDRIVNIKVDGEALELDKTYELATNNFLRDGGDGYTMFEGKKLVVEKEALNELLIDYIENLGTVSYEVEERITEGTATEEPEEKPEEKPEVEEPETEEPEDDEDDDKAAIEDKYVVKKGDVLYRIALKFNTTWQKLAKFNDMKNPSLIYPGDIIMIPEMD